MKHEADEHFGITYHIGSASEMDFLPDLRLEKAVSNHVLLDILDYTAALRHVRRVLRPDGCFVVVIRHPCFSSGPSKWLVPASDPPHVRTDLPLECIVLSSGYVFRTVGQFKPGHQLTPSHP
jgi:ubiquinone/menaquinone biosynthesis C-methylase UbiE